MIAAEQYAAGIALPPSQRTYRTRWGSHEDLAAKALKKLAGPHVPASLKQLERAIECAHAAHEQAIGPKPSERASDEQDRTQGREAPSRGTG